MTASFNNQCCGFIDLVGNTPTRPMQHLSWHHPFTLQQLIFLHKEDYLSTHLVWCPSM